MLPAVAESATAGPSAGPIWLTRSKFRVVVLARHVLADDAVAERHVFAAEMRGGGEEADSARGAADHERKHARRSFLVKIAERIEHQQALRRDSCVM